MKKLNALVVLTLVCSSLGNLAFADAEKSSKTYSVTVNPLSLLIGFANAGFNFGVTDRMTLGVGGDYFYVESGGSSATGYGGNIRMNYYLSGPRLSDSWYVSPFVSLTNYDVGASVLSFGTGVIAGYQWVYDSGFTMMLGGGVRYSSLSAGSISALKGVHGTGEFSIGFVW